MRHRLTKNLRRLAGCALLLLCLQACSNTSGLAPDSLASPIESQLLAEIALERGDYRTAVIEYLNVARASEDVAYAQQATELAYDVGFDAHALAAAERWLELEPGSALLHGYLARLYTRFDRQDEAWNSLQIALGPEDERSDQDFTFLAGDLASSPRQTLTLFQRLNETYPDTAGITRSLAELQAQNGNLDAAVDLARQTLSLRPDWNDTRVWLARLLLLQGERTAAFEQMAFAQEMNPGLEYELEFVRLLAAADELQAAADRLERLSERYPGERGIALTGAALFVQAGELEDAEAIYLQLLTGGVCLAECYWHLGAIAFERGDYEGAIGLFRRIVAGERLQPARLAISQSYELLGDTDAALAELEQFAADYPKRAFTVLQPQATLLLGAGRYEEAIGASALSLEYRPWSEGLWLSHGAVLEQAGQLEKALDAFRRAWELAPDSATTRNAYGYTLTIATDRLEEAESLIRAALEQEPDNAAIMDSMGWVLFRQGRREEARGWLEDAWAAMPDPEIGAHLGELLWVTGERDAAREIWREAEERFPDSRPLRETMERFLE